MLGLPPNLLCASQAAILLQAVFLAAHHSPVQTHDLGLWAFLSSLVTAIAASFQLLSISQHAHTLEDAALILRIVNVCTVVILVLACLSIPRRPHVFYKGHQVDPEWTVSAINRYTWTWAGALLTLARKKGDLDEKDIPRPDHYIRAENLVAEWSKANYQGGLLRSLFRAYGNRLILQWCITAGRCVLGIGPFWTMLRLVQKLEKKDTDESPKSELWVLIFCMGLFTLTEQVRIPLLPLSWYLWPCSS